VFFILFCFFVFSLLFHVFLAFSSFFGSKASLFSREMISGMDEAERQMAVVPKMPEVGKMASVGLPLVDEMEAGVHGGMAGHLARMVEEGHDGIPAEGHLERMEAVAHFEGMEAQGRLE
jgi:hypothetical protein